LKQRDYLKMQNFDLKDIKWVIEFKPTEQSVTWREFNLNLTREELNTVVLDFPSNIFLNFPLNDDYSAFKLLEIEGKQTLRSLFTIIYNFYGTKIAEEDINKIFANYQELYEILLDEANEIKYIDVFDTDCGDPDFVGLEEEQKEDEKIVLRVNLGPL
jgi:hypothetical protein